MKTYLINTLRNISTASRSLDFVSTIKASEWIIFNEDKSIIEKFIFADNENMLVSINGKTSYSKWKYIKINTSLVIDDGTNKYLFKVIVCNENIIVLNIDSTNNYSFLINAKSSLKNKTYESIQWYLMKQCGLDILNEKQRELYLEEKRKEQIRKEAEAKRRELEQKRFTNKLLIGVGVIFVAVIIGCCINNYIEYKKKHPTLYITEKQNQKAVDLGLSVKWATCNIGANNPEEYGNYYGWGEPTGTDVFGHDSEPIRELIKRFPARDNGTLPPYSIINSSKDIAKYNWGGNWRMPTKDEVQELLDKCDIRLYESRGRKFAKVIGPNGNSIIIPSAGYVDGTGGNWVLKYKHYSIYLYIGELYSPVSASEYAENKASYLFIGDDYDKNFDNVSVKRISAIERYRMLPVRAVMDK